MSVDTASLKVTSRGGLRRDVAGGSSRMVMNRPCGVEVVRVLLCRVSAHLLGRCFHASESMLQKLGWLRSRRRIARFVQLLGRNGADSTTHEVDCCDCSCGTLRSTSVTVVRSSWNFLSVFVGIADRWICWRRDCGSRSKN